VNESVYRRLCRQATAILRHENLYYQMEPTDLLHEALLRIARSQVEFGNESHLFALGTLVMRRILIDHVRRADSPRRLRCVPLESVMQPSADPAPETEPLHDILRQMQSSEARLHSVVKMRFFWGFGIEEIAAALSVSPRTVKRDWNLARGWLRRELFNKGIDS
jgi:RNA polymerase sigma factor (TIGR02999 family)